MCRSKLDVWFCLSTATAKREIWSDVGLALSIGIISLLRSSTDFFRYGGWRGISPTCLSKPFFSRKQFHGLFFILTLNKGYWPAGTAQSLEPYYPGPGAQALIQGQSLEYLEESLNRVSVSRLTIHTASLGQELEKALNNVWFHSLWRPRWDCAVRLKTLSFKQRWAGGRTDILLWKMRRRMSGSTSGERPTLCLKVIWGWRAEIASLVSVVSYSFSLVKMS